MVRFIPAGSNRSLVINDLKPFTQYDIRIQTCVKNQTRTEFESCNVGLIDDVKTLSAPPVGLADPVIKSTSPTSVVITWKPPSLANGVITGYQIYRRVPPTEQQLDPYKDRVYLSSDSSTLSYTDKGLQPFTEYDYQLQVSNREGVTASSWVGAMTQQGVPTGLLRPILEAVSAYAIKATWDPPKAPNGVVTNYR